MFIMTFKNKFTRDVIVM